MATYGYATVVPQSQTGVQPAEAAFMAGSAVTVLVSVFDTTGLPLAPAAISYEVWAQSSGTLIVPWTTLPAAAAVTEIVITSDQNVLIDKAVEYEVHQIICQIIDSSKNIYLASAEFTVLANPNIYTPITIDSSNPIGSGGTVSA